MDTAAKRTGRPRSFDRDAAVRTAVQLFRRYGYEGVSLAMLTTAFGIAPPSLYAAFGSKAGLYREALDRYISESALSLVAKNGVDLPLEEAIDGMFERAIKLVAGPPEACGCMILTGLLGSHPDHRNLADELVARRRAMAEGFADELERWLTPTRSKSVACYLCAVLQGIAVQARDGAGREALLAIALIARSGVISAARSDLGK